MGRILVTEFVTLDEVMETPENWVGMFWADGMLEFKQNEIESAEAQLLGKGTYEIFAGSWPTRSDDTGFADRMNTMPRFVVSKTLESALWTNLTVLNGAPNDEVAKLKMNTNGDLNIAGSGKLVNGLVADDLVDEYRLVIIPTVLGSGQRLFNEGSSLGALKLVDSCSFPSGVVANIYQPVRD